MAHYNVFVQDSSPLFIYSPPGAWTDTPLGIDNSPSLSYHATHVQDATVKLDFFGTGVRVFSATAPAPGSYEVYVDGKRVANSSSTLDSQLLLGSITGLEMTSHTVTLVNSGVTGEPLDFDHVEVESVLTSGSSSLSTATFDDTAGEIQWGPGWVSALGRSTFYNGTICYTEEPDAKMSFSFEGDAIAIYGTTGVEMGNYMVTLDGQSHTFNGGSDGSARIPHDKTILYLANGLGVGRHKLTITANPSPLGQPHVFNVDSIGILSDDSASGPVLLPPDPFDTGTSSTLPPPAPTGSGYTSVISNAVFPTLKSLPTPTSSTLSPSFMSSSSSTSPIVLPTAEFNGFPTNHVLQAASADSKVLTNEGVISSAIVSAIVAGIGLIFFALFIWKRKNLDPPSYIDLEKANKLDEKGPPIEPGEKSPELPIQPADRISPVSEETEGPFADFASYDLYRRSSIGRTQGHSRNGSNDSSITANDFAYNSYRETLQKRALLTGSISSTDSTSRDSVPDYGSKDLRSTRTSSRGSSVHSSSSELSGDTLYSQTSERIVISNVRMPPQFSTPTRPLSAATPSRPNRTSPPRPPRVRDCLALPF